MQQISEKTLNTFEAKNTDLLIERIDSWLGQELLRWTFAASQVRLLHLKQMCGSARAAGMRSERDYAVFAWMCVAIGKDWEKRMWQSELAPSLRNPEFSPEAKLMALDEKFQLSMAER